MKTLATSVEFIGEEFETAYAQILGGAVNGGLRDGGRDVLTGIPEIPAVQVKASPVYAMRSLAKSLQFREFIPICVGDPCRTTKEAIVASIKQFGAFVGPDVSVDRNTFLAGVRQVRDICGTGGGVYVQPR